MMIKISTIFVVLVVPAALAEHGHAGYDYQAPAISYQLPSNLRPNPPQAQNNQGHELQNVFHPSPIYHQYFSGDVYKNQQTQHALHFNNQGYNSAQSYHNINYNSFTPNYSNGNLIGAQSVQQTLQQIPVQNPSFTNPPPQQPVITKHIYFHLPPPDDTANAAPVTRPAPKKSYNIIFVKLPSQKSTSAARLQELINQQAAADSKTLIYVLVKNPVTTPIQPVTSRPEVFFVKYKEPRNLVQSVYSGVVQVPQGGTGLLPGQINGHGEK